MFRIERIFRKLKGIRLKPDSKPEEGITRNNSFTIDEIGYEASSLLSQEEHRQKNRKS
jgi:hypothetical protein